MALPTKNKFKLRPGHLIIFVVFIIVRKSFATESGQSSHGGTTDHTNFDSHKGHSEADKNGGTHEHGGHEGAHFSVFHVNFEHVEVPFIIGLWIFVSSLAKVGELKTSIFHFIFHHH